ncbi:MAG: glutaredoxin family protein [Acidobacteriota bacterium]
MEKKVKIYTTPTCNYCKMAKDFLTEKGIDFEAHDVTTDREALEEMRKISGGARSVPVIAICDQVLVGFDQQAVEEALADCQA